MLNLPSASSFLGHDTYITMSSAYIVKLQFMKQVEKSFMKSTKSRGPKIDPCGTPNFTSEF